MSAVAVVVGIDAYRGQPLTSAVRDALAFRDALLRLGLVDVGSVTLLSAPAQDGGLLATRDQITAALRQPYLHGDDVDRMYVFLSGHGMLVPGSVSRSTSATAFLPADVIDPIAEPWKLLNIDNLLHSFRTAGPREQFFFIDACRDLRYEQYPPELASIGLAGRDQPAVGVRAQGAVYAVSPGGQALGSREGLGVMTGHLIQALHGTGEALDYDEMLDSYVVTMQSVYAYVRARIEEQVSGLPTWQRQYMLPDPALSGPPLTPIRLVPDPGPASLTLTVEPPGDAQYLWVNLLLRGARLAEPQWPPEVFGQPVPVPRQRFRLSAVSNMGATGVEPELIDGRIMTSARIKHHFIGALGPGPRLPLPVAPPRDPGLGPATVVEATGARLPWLGDAADPWNERPGGLLRGATEEPWAAMEISGLSPPYYPAQTVRPWQGVLPDVLVPAGLYQVTFRVGSQAFSQGVAEVEDGKRTSVRASSAASPLVASLIGAREHPSSVLFSEAVGPVQANPALSLVTLIALGRMHGAEGLVDFLPWGPAGLGGDLSLVIAVDGSGWPEPASAVAAGIRVVVKGALLAERPVSLEPAGMDQIVTAVASISTGYPWSGYTLALRSEQAGDVEVAVASVPGMGTCVGIVLGAAGGIDVAQVITPGELDHSAVVRHAQRSLLGQWLYQGGELTSYGPATEPDELRDVLTGQATDPVLSPMAFHAWSDVLAGDDPDRPPGHPDAARFREQVGRQLIAAFPTSPDARVIAALLDDSERTQVESLARDGPMPVLADSARAAVAMLGDAPAPLSSMVRRVAPGSLWTLRWTQPGEGS